MAGSGRVSTLQTEAKNYSETEAPRDGRQSRRFRRERGRDSGCTLRRCQRRVTDEAEILPSLLIKATSPKILNPIDGRAIQCKILKIQKHFENYIYSN